MDGAQRITNALIDAAECRLLRFDPAVPQRLLPLSVRGVNLSGSALTLDGADDGTWTLTGLPPGVDLAGGSRRPSSVL